MHDGLLQDLEHDRAAASRWRSSRRTAQRVATRGAAGGDATAEHQCRRPCSRSASTRRSPTTSPGRCSTASTATTGCSAAESARAKHRFETADWHGQQRAQRERIEFYDLRVRRGGRRGCEKEFKAGEQPMEVWQQVKLHYIGLLIDHHQPELRRDLLQLGHDEDPAPQLLPQRLHLRAAGGLHRVHRERRAGGAADLPRLLPDARDAARDAGAHRRQLPARARVRRPASATSSCVLGGDRTRSSAHVQAARQLPDPGAVVAVLPQQGRLRRRQDHQRLQRDCRSRCRSCTTTSGQLVIDTACSARTTCSCCSASRAPTSWSTWRCRRPTCSSCAR